MKKTLTLLLSYLLISNSYGQTEKAVAAVDSLFQAQQDSILLVEKRDASDKEFKRTKNVQKRKDRDYYETKRGMKGKDLQRLRKQYKIKTQ